MTGYVPHLPDVKDYDSKTKSQKRRDKSFVTNPELYRMGYLKAIDSFERVEKISDIILLGVKGGVRRISLIDDDFMHELLDDEQ